MWSVALDFGARAFDSQELGGVSEPRSIVEIDLQALAAILEPDLDGRGHALLLELARFFRQHDGDAIPYRIGEAAFRLMSSLLARSYSRGPLVRGQTSISSRRGSTGASRSRRSARYGNGQTFRTRAAS